MKHALNLALRDKEISEHEKTNMLSAWLEAEKSDEGGSHEGRIEKVKKLFGNKFGPRGQQLFIILHKSVDKIREALIANGYSQDEAERQAQALALMGETMEEGVQISVKRRRV